MLLFSLYVSEGGGFESNFSLWTIKRPDNLLIYLFDMNNSDIVFFFFGGTYTIVYGHWPYVYPFHFKKDGISYVKHIQDFCISIFIYWFDMNNSDIVFIFLFIFGTYTTVYGHWPHVYPFHFRRDGISCIRRI